jgi:hypothetical protein
VPSDSSRLGDPYRLGNLRLPGDPSRLGAGSNLFDIDRSEPPLPVLLESREGATYRPSADGLDREADPLGRLQDTYQRFACVAHVCLRRPRYTIKRRFDATGSYFGTARSSTVCSIARSKPGVAPRVRVV